MSTGNSIQLPRGVKDETGNPYGKLKVVQFAGIRRKLAHWLCSCECGNTTIVAGDDLRKKSTLSCGCHRASARGMCKSSEYTSWKEMKRRCYNTRNSEYHNYGGRGITVCQRWLDAFVNFFEDMGPKPFAEATIDRKDGNGNYEKENCRWATKLEQGQNTSKARNLTYNGETYGLREWARRIGITHGTLSARLARGWSLEKALTTPAMQEFNPHK